MSLSRFCFCSFLCMYAALSLSLPFLISLDALYSECWHTKLQLNLYSLSFRICYLNSISMFSLICVNSCDLVFKEVSRRFRSQLKIHIVRFQGYLLMVQEGNRGSRLREVHIYPEIDHNQSVNLEMPNIHRTRGPSAEVASKVPTILGTVWSD